MAAANTLEVWFKLEGAAQADCAVLSPETKIVSFRHNVKESLAGQLQERFGRIVDASELCFTVDGKTYNRGGHLVAIITTTEDNPLIVTGALACLLSTSTATS